MSLQTLIETIKTGTLNDVQELLARDPQVAFQKIEGEPSPLLLSAYYGKLDIAVDLLSRGVPLNLFEASALGELSAVTKLVGENINGYSSDGFTPLGYACFFGHVPIVQFLLAHGANPNLSSNNPMKVAPIHSAVANRDKEIAFACAYALIQYGADVNVQQHGGWTPLHQAAHHGYTEVVQLLLRAGAKLLTPADDGSAPADKAQEAGYPELAQLLGGV